MLLKSEREDVDQLSDFFQVSEGRDLVNGRFPDALGLSFVQPAIASPARKALFESYPFIPLLFQSRVIPTGRVLVQFEK